MTKWPLIVNHDGPWPLFEGVETCMLVALSLLSFLGLRYPIKMLPILLFEIGWKLIWLTVDRCATVDRRPASTRPR